MFRPVGHAGIHAVFEPRSFRCSHLRLVRGSVGFKGSLLGGRERRGVLGYDIFKEARGLRAAWGSLSHRTERTGRGVRRPLPVFGLLFRTAKWAGGRSKRCIARSFAALTTTRSFHTPTSSRNARVCVAPACGTMRWPRRSGRGGHRDRKPGFEALSQLSGRPSWIEVHNAALRITFSGCGRAKITGSSDPDLPQDEGQKNSTKTGIRPGQRRPLLLPGRRKDLGANRATAAGANEGRPALAGRQGKANEGLPLDRTADDAGHGTIFHSTMAGSRAASGERASGDSGRTPDGGSFRPAWASSYYDHGRRQTSSKPSLLRDGNGVENGVGVGDSLPDASHCVPSGPFSTSSAQVHIGNTGTRLFPTWPRWAIDRGRGNYYLVWRHQNDRRQTLGPTVAPQRIGGARTLRRAHPSPPRPLATRARLAVLRTDGRHGTWGRPRARWSARPASSFRRASGPWVHAGSAGKKPWEWFGTRYDRVTDPTCGPAKSP